MLFQLCAEPDSPSRLALTTANGWLMLQESALPTVRHVRSTGVGALGCPAAVAILILASVLLTGCSSSPDQDTPTPGSPSIVQSAPTGREIFESNCATCHGAGGEGQPDWHVRKEDGTLPPPPLNGDGHTWHHADGLLYRIVSQGGKILEAPRYPSFKSAMPAFGERLSHQEIVEVLTYVKSLWGNKTKRGLSIRDSQALVSEQHPFPSEGR